MPHERVLDIIGRMEGTNKSDYGFLEAYEPLFRPFRDEAFNLLEIGVYQGASLRTWRTYFPKAQIIGLDINPKCRQYAGEHIDIEIGSQGDGEILDRIISQYSPLIVIDDGSHLAHHVIFSFEQIFPQMPDGGLYVVEDAYMHFGAEEQEHLGLSKVRCSEYFMTLATRLVSKIFPPEENDTVAKYLFDHVESIAFSHGAIMLRKKHAPLDSAQKIAAAEAVVAGSGNPDHELSLARVMVAFGGPLDRSEELVRNLIARRGPSPETLFRLSEVLERQNRIVEAIAALEQAETLEEGWSLIVDHVHVLARLTWLYTRINEHDEAVRSAYQLVKVAPGYMDGRRMLRQALEQTGKLREAIEEAKRAADLTTDERHAAEIKTDIGRMLAKISAGTG